MRTIWLMTFVTLATPLQAQERCEFSLVGERPKAEMTAGANGDQLVRAIKVVDQPDSPLAITSLDLRGLTLNASLSQYTMEGTISVEVMNISDVPVLRVEFGRAAGWRDGSASGRWSFDTHLRPGERSVYSFSGRSGGGTALPAELTVVVGVDAVSIGNCRHEPSVTAASALRALLRQ